MMKIDAQKIAMAIPILIAAVGLVLLVVQGHYGWAIGIVLLVGVAYAIFRLSNRHKKGSGWSGPQDAPRPSKPQDTTPTKGKHGKRDPTPKQGPAKK